MTKQLKAAVSVSQHIELLRWRGMAVDDPLARQWLEQVSYYRLSAYWFPAREVEPTGYRSDRFRTGTTFEDVTSLYEADRKLRTLLHDGLERVEIALRTHIGNQLYDRGPLGYTEAARFRPTFDHQRWLGTAEKRVTRAGRHNESINHYKNAYGQFPFWVLAEVLDFADVSRLFEGLPAKDQHAISEAFGIHVDWPRSPGPSERRHRRRHRLSVGWSNSPSFETPVPTMDGCGTSRSRPHRPRLCGPRQNSRCFPWVRANDCSARWWS